MREQRDPRPHFVSIGNADLIQKRKTRLVPIPPHGVLDDYVPFYFCTHSLMLYNIHTGYSVARVEQREVVYLVSSVQKLEADRIPFLFTDRHAYPVTAKYFRPKPACYPGLGAPARA